MRKPRVATTQLDHLVLEVRDVGASLNFYDKMLGLGRVREQAFLDGTAPFASVRVNRRTLVDLFPRQMWRSRTPTNPNHFCLSVEPSVFRALLRRLKGHHVGIVRSVKHNFGARGFADSICLLDPDGVEVEVRYYPTRRGRRRTRG